MPSRPLMPSAAAVRELHAVVVSMKALPAKLRATVRTDTRTTMGPVWKQLVTGNARTTQERAVLAGGTSGAGVRIAGTNPPVLVAASSRRARSGGLVPADDYSSVELGTRRPNLRATWSRTSPEGTRHQVRGWPERQLQNYRKGGYVVFPAVREIAPRIVKFWTASIVRHVYDALERR